MVNSIIVEIQGFRDQGMHEKQEKRKNEGRRLKETQSSSLCE